MNSTFSEPNVIPTDRDTGLNEPLSTERNKTLPLPAGVNAPPLSDEDNLKTTPAELRSAGVVRNIEGEIKIIDGKVLHNQGMIEEGWAIEHGVPLKK